MSAGIPLTDGDRWDWLVSLREGAIQSLSPSADNNYRPPDGVVVACSALKRKYRDVVRVAAYGSPYIRVHFIYLRLDAEALAKRLEKRAGHYMKSGMLQSQLKALEEPGSEEWDVDTINADAPPKDVLRRVEEVVSERLSTS